MLKNAALTLIPTPLHLEDPLDPVTLDFISGICKSDSTLLLVEEHKEARQRWIRWGLPRECIENFILYNEHTQQELNPKIIQELKDGKKAILLSDGGLPAFCDPGQELIDLCHKNSLRVTSAPFSNSVLLALVLSGFKNNRFIFEGFLSAKKEEREKSLNKILTDSRPIILMDTPYRLNALLQDLQKLLNPKRQVCVAMDLNGEKEKILRGKIGDVLESISKSDKAEFVLVIEGLS